MNYQKLPDKKEYELYPLSQGTPLPNAKLNFAPSFSSTQISVPVAQPLSYPQSSQTQALYAPQNVTQPLTQAGMQPMYANPVYMYYPGSGMSSASQSFASGSFNPGSFTAAPKRENYYNQIPNDLYTKTTVIGAMKESSLEFDDYFETIKDMFFTPEIHEIKFYHTNDYIWGVQVIYRDPWGKAQDKELKKAKPHLGKSQQAMNYTQTSIMLEYDDNITDIRGSGTSIVKGLRIETLKGKLYQVGCKENYGENLVPPMAKVVGLGGTHNNFCLESLYFYLI